MNVENFRRVLQYIEAHPKKWDQSEWCGTACCIAGHAQRFAGLKRDLWSTPQAALNYLELSPGEAAWMFAPERTLDDFRRVLQIRGRYKDAPRYVLTHDEVPGVRRMIFGGFY